VLGPRARAVRRGARGRVHVGRPCRPRSSAAGRAGGRRRAAPRGGRRRAAPLQGAPDASAPRCQVFQALLLARLQNERHPGQPGVPVDEKLYQTTMRCGPRLACAQPNAAGLRRVRAHAHDGALSHRTLQFAAFAFGCHLRLGVHVSTILHLLGRSYSAVLSRMCEVHVCTIACVPPPRLHMRRRSTAVSGQGQV
jgi:hypothetical protein